jgi:cell wall-associated NlpC family hydrolase
MWQAAQAVQHSADGRAYARWQGFGLALAAAWYAGRPVAGVPEAPGTGGTASAGRACDRAGSRPSAPAPEQVRTVLAAAGSQLGRPYVWGGGDASGPTGGVQGVRPPGFDCSGLVLYAFAQVGVELPHSSAAQYRAGRHVPVSQALPGDLIFLSSDGTPGGIHHDALVWSSGRIIEAADFGIPVRVRSFAGPAEPQIMPDAVRII